MHGLTRKMVDGKVVAHPLYWVWREKRKSYPMSGGWEESVVPFVHWALAEGWKMGSGDSIRRFDTKKPYSPDNCYVHPLGSALRRKKDD